MDKSENRLNQLRHFFKEYKQVNGLYFSHHFSNHHYKKLILDLVDIFDKKTIKEPIFSLNCDQENSKKSPRICLFNIETINKLMDGKEFDEDAFLICPICKKTSKIMSFYYEKSISQIIEKIRSFITNNKEDQIFQISIKPNFHWKTKNFVYLKGIIKLDGKKDSEDELENYDFFDNFVEIEKKIRFEDIPLYEDLYLKEENLEEKEMILKEKNLDTQEKGLKNFVLIRKNSNFLFVYKFSEFFFDYVIFQLVLNNKSSTACSLIPLIYYQNYEFIHCGINGFFIFTDAGTILKNEDLLQNAVFSNEKKTLNFFKFHCFEKRFHSPKLHYFKEFIYCLGGFSIDNENLKSCYKISITNKKDENCAQNLSDMINFRRDYCSILMENQEKIYIGGGKVMKDHNFVRNNTLLLDVYNLKNDQWEEILIDLLDYSLINSSFIRNMIEKNENEIFIIGNKMNFSLNVETKIVTEERLQLIENPMIENLLEVIRNSLKTYNLENIDFSNDKNFLILKYGFENK